jgi:hypothetical protein
MSAPVIRAATRGSPLAIWQTAHVAGLLATALPGLEVEVVTMGDIFEFKQTGVGPDGRVKGAFVSTGYIPRCLKLFEERGVTLPREIFWTAA